MKPSFPEKNLARQYLLEFKQIHFIKDFLSYRDGETSSVLFGTSRIEQAIDIQLSTYSKSLHSMDQGISQCVHASLANIQIALFEEIKDDISSHKLYEIDEKQINRAIARHNEIHVHPDLIETTHLKEYFLFLKGIITRFKKVIDKYLPLYEAGKIPCQNHFHIHCPFSKTKETLPPVSKDFTTSRQVLAIHYLLKYSKVENIDNTVKARFAQFLTGKEQNAKSIKNTTLYKKVISPLRTNDKALKKDLLFVKSQFQLLGLLEIVKMIENEIDQGT